jgi:hypothetical protein
MKSQRFNAILHGLALPAAALAIALAGVVIGLRLADAGAEQTALGRVDFEVNLAAGGGVEGYVPIADWGFRADAFDSAFGLRAELRTVNRQALADAAGGDRTVLTETRMTLSDGAERAVLRAIAWIAGVTLVLGAIATLAWPRARARWWVLPALTAGAFAVVVGGAVGVARATYDSSALESPTYYARGAELEQLLDAAEGAAVESAYGSELESILRSISAVLAEEPLRESPGRELIAASDLHANALVVDPLARFFGDAPLIFAGDVGQRGTDLEASLLAGRVAALSDAVIAVSGNHDSTRLMDALVDEGVEVLGDPPRPAETTAEDLIIAGFPDPLEAAGYPGDPDRDVTFEDMEGGPEGLEAAKAALDRWFAGLETAPDIVVVHQNALAQALAEGLWEDGWSSPLTVVTGHDHLQHIDRYGAITVVDGGTIGAGGVFDAGVSSSGFARLHFNGETPELEAVDLVAVEPFSGRGRGSRVVIDEICPGEERCTYRPSEAEVDIPGEVENESESGANALDPATITGRP